MSVHVHHWNDENLKYIWKQFVLFVFKFYGVSLWFELTFSANKFLIANCLL